MAEEKRLTATSGNGLSIPDVPGLRSKPGRAADGARLLPCARTWTTAFLAAAFLYVLTANRGAQWQDSGWQQQRIATRTIEHPLGLALTHPVQHYLGRGAARLLPVEPAFAATLVSCVFAAAAVANVFLLIDTLQRSRVAGAAAALTLGLSHTFWQHATHTESYAIVAALLSAECLFLAWFLRGGHASWLIAAATANGVGVATHLLALLATPIYAVLLVRAVRARRVGAATFAGVIAAWVVGTLPYTLLVLNEWAATGDAVATLRSALFGKFAAEVLNTRITPAMVGLMLGYFVYNFPGLALPLAVIGARAGADVPRGLTRTLQALLGVHLAFVVRYSVKDQYTFFIPSYVLVSIFAGIGLARVIERHRKASRVIAGCALATATWTPLVYFLTANVMRSAGAVPGLVANKPYRDGYRSFFVPWGVGNTSADELNAAARRLAGRDGLILVADAMLTFAIRYDQTVGRMPGSVSIEDLPPRRSPAENERLRERLAAALRDGRPVVLVPADRDRPEMGLPEARWRREGDLYVLTGLVPPDAGE